MFDALVAVAVIAGGLFVVGFYVVAAINVVLQLLSTNPKD